METTQRPGEGPASGEGASLKGEAKQALERTGEELKRSAGELREQSGRVVGDVKERVAGGIESAAEALRHTAGNMREQGNASLAGYAEKAADRLERLGSNLRERRIGDHVASLERLARREPLLFFGGAVLLGLLGARFLKSSSTGHGADEGPEHRPLPPHTYRGMAEAYDEPYDADDTSAAVDRELEGRL